MTESSLEVNIQVSTSDNPQQQSNLSGTGDGGESSGLVVLTQVGQLDSNKDHTVHYHQASPSSETWRSKLKDVDFSYDSEGDKEFTLSGCEEDYDSDIEGEIKEQGEWKGDN